MYRNLRRRKKCIKRFKGEKGERDRKDEVGHLWDLLHEKS